MNIIHLFPLHKGDMKFVHPGNSHMTFLLDARGKYDYFEGEQISYFPYAREINVLFHQANVLVNSAN